MLSHCPENKQNIPQAGAPYPKNMWHASVEKVRTGQVEVSACLPDAGVLSASSQFLDPKILASAAVA